jgi:hypothetical protein
LRGLRAMFKRQTSWKALTQRFQATDVHKFSGRYKRQTGCFDEGPENAVSGQFLIELAQEGFLVTPYYFARRSPILIACCVTSTNSIHPPPRGKT